MQKQITRSISSYACLSPYKSLSPSTSLPSSSPRHTTSSCFLSQLSLLLKHFYNSRLMKWLFSSLVFLFKFGIFFKTETMQEFNLLKFKGEVQDSWVYLIYENVMCKFEGYDFGICGCLRTWLYWSLVW